MNRKVEGIDKDWIKPVAASIAKLQLVQSQVKNMGHKSANSLKPPESEQNLVQLKQLVGLILEGENDLKNENLPEQHVYGQRPINNDAKFKSHYASFFNTRDNNTLISELIARHRKQITSHPLSEQVQTRPRYDSFSEVKRLSTTDPFGAGDFSDAFPETGINTMVEPDYARCSLESSDEESVDNTSKPEIQPVRLPICLSLPSAYIESDDEDETGIQRLLPQADDTLNRKVEEYNSAVQNLKEARFLASDSTEVFKPISHSVNFQRRQSENITQSDITDTIAKKHSNSNRKPTTQSRTNICKLEVISSLSDVSSTSEEQFPYYCAAADGANNRQEKGKIVTLNNISRVQDVKCNNRKPIINNNDRCTIPLHFVTSHTKLNLRSLSCGKVKIRDDKNVAVGIAPDYAERSFTRKPTYSVDKKSANALIKCENGFQIGDSTYESGCAAKSSNKKRCSHNSNNDTISNNENNINLLSGKSNSTQVPIVTVDYDDNNDPKEPNLLSKKSHNYLEAVTSQQSKGNTNSHTLGALYKSSKENNIDKIGFTYASRLVHNTLTENESVSETTGEKQDIHGLIKTTKTYELNPNVFHQITCKSQIHCVNHKNNPRKSFNYKKYQPTTHTVCHDSGQRVQKDLPLSGKKLEISTPAEKLFTRVNTPVQKNTASNYSGNNRHLVKPSVQVQNRISSAPKVRSQPVSSDSVKTYSKQSASCMLSKAKPVQIDTKICAVKSAIPTTRTQTSDHLSNQPEQCDSGTAEAEECHTLQTKRADLGVDVGVKALESAIYHQSGKSQYSHLAGYLPSDPSYGLIPHYKHWLPEEYSKLQMFKQKLAEDNRLRRLQRRRITRQMMKLPVWMNDKIRNNYGEKN